MNINFRGSQYAVGAVEKANRTHIKKIRKLYDFEKKKDWETVVKNATYAIDLSFNRPIGTSLHALRYKENTEIKIRGFRRNYIVIFKKLTVKFKKRNVKYRK